MFSNCCLLKAKEGHGHSVQRSSMLSHTSSSWCHSSSTLLCFSFHDWPSSFYLFLRMCVVRPLSLFITSVTIVLHNSMVSFTCFHVFFSSPNQLVLLNPVEYSRAHWKPITPAHSCSCWDTMCWFAPKLFASLVGAPFVFSMVGSSSSPFHTAVSRWIWVLVFVVSLSGEL